jgi:hypothetical protein
VDSTDSEYGPLAGCCECGHETSGSGATELFISCMHVSLVFLRNSEMNTLCHFQSVFYRFHNNLHNQVLIDNDYMAKFNFAHVYETCHEIGWVA